MRLFQLSKLSQQLKLFLAKNNIFYYALLAFCLFLPFQFALNPSNGIDLAVVRILIPLMFLAWMVTTLKKKMVIFKLNWMTYLLIIFFVLAVISLFFSLNISWSVRKLFFPLSIAPLYFLTAGILDTTNKKRAAITALVIGATAVAWIGILQFASQFIFGIDKTYSFIANHLAPFFLGNSFSASVLAYPSWLVNAGGITYMRTFAIFPDPHMLSYYLGMLIPFSIALWATTTLHKKFLIFSILSLIIADVLTFTRGGYLALIAGAIIILPLVSLKTAKKILAGIGVFVFLFLLVPHNPVTGRFVSSFDAQEGSNQARLTNWQQAFSIIMTHPFGVGIGAYSLTVKPTATYREPIYAHNAYLDIAAELGIIASLVFIGILLLAFKNFWRMSKREPFFIAGAASITIFAAHSLVENPLYSVHILPLLLIILAISASTNIYEETANA